MKKRTLLGLATVSSLLFSSQGAFAHSAAEAQPGGLRDLMGHSAAVAFGKVVDIQYRNSEPDSGRTQWGAAYFRYLCH
ncbi:hypothetical protein [Methylobacter luteus]|uniref:hypothetical protein n=1 Tax=Methylobacter luteus TaxID=415 RepID=UPI0004857234|nr:hypothetical protein [Methylobacter luteus]